MFLTRPLLKSLLMIFLVFQGCKKESAEPQPTADSACRIETSISEYNQQNADGKVFGKAKMSVIYKYDTDLKLIKDSSEFVNNENEVVIEEMTTSSDKKYDDKGFLISVKDRNYHKIMRNGELVGLNNENEFSYIYAGNKLSETWAGGMKTESYTYHSDGSLSSYTSYTTDGNQEVRTFEKGVQKSYKDTGQSADRKATFNEKGFQTRVTFSSGSYYYEYRNSYDDKGNRLLAEVWINGRRDSYSEYEYGQANLQFMATYLPKGHVKIPSIVGSDASLLIRSTSYITDPGLQKLVKNYEQVNTYTLNGQGLIIKNEGKTSAFDLTGKPSNITNWITDYTYTGCN